VSLNRVLSSNQPFRSGRESLATGCIAKTFTLGFSLSVDIGYMSCCFSARTAAHLALKVTYRNCKHKSLRFCLRRIFRRAVEGRPVLRSIVPQAETFFLPAPSFSEPWLNTRKLPDLPILTFYPESCDRGGRSYDTVV
jgi:hypothetical protein